MKALVLVGLAACGVGDVASTDGGATGGHITGDTTWSGTHEVLEATTIDPGITVTVTAGTTITVKSGVAITVQGTLAIHGATGSVVTIAPAAGAASFGGINLPSGGTLDMTYAVVTGTSITTSGSGVATIRDSQLSHAPGDLLIMNGGTIDVQYSAIGVEPPSLDTTHCDLHFGGVGGNAITFTHSNVSSSAYGAMFYAGQSANFTYDNWFSNQTNVDTQPGINGDFSNGYFQGAAPTGIGITATNLANARLVACGGGNDATCAGIRP
jgi:hypothetical protein